MSARYVRLGTHISVGACYPNGGEYISWYKVLSIGDGYAELCRPSDGWTLKAVNPAIYETPYGQQLQWDYSKYGRFLKANRECI